jgi:guanine deaminase
MIEVESFCGEFSMSKNLAIRCAALTFVADPFLTDSAKSYRYESDALVVMEHGKITAFGPYEELRDKLPPVCPIKWYKDSLLIPGFIDTHIHYPQTQIIGAYGKQLIDWLNNYTFKAEAQFKDYSYAKKIAEFFIDQTIKAGTTTMMTYCTVHPESVDAFFEVAQHKKMRAIAGKVLMDRNAPENLLDKTVKDSYEESKTLIKKWHGKDRLLYAITPRFAPTSSPAQLEMTGSLWAEHPGTYLQSHLNENKGEIEWVKELYPDRKDYLDVYDHYKLLGPKAVYGHAVHMSESDWERMSHTKTSIAHCPTSNEFLGSGLFDFMAAKKVTRPVRVGLASDIGAGTNLCALVSMNESYKIAQLQGYALSSIHAFYLATRGAAESLELEDKIGSLQVGHEADLLILDLKSTDLINFRMNYAKSIEEILFILMTLGDDRATRSVYIAGECAYEREG